MRAIDALTVVRSRVRGISLEPTRRVDALIVEGRFARWGVTNPVVLLGVEDWHPVERDLGVRGGCSVSPVQGREVLECFDNRDPLAQCWRLGFRVGPQWN